MGLLGFGIASLRTKLRTSATMFLRRGRFTLEGTSRELSGLPVFV